MKVTTAAMVRRSMKPAQKPKTKKTKKEGDENATPTVKKVKQVELCSDEDSESREK